MTLIIAVVDVAAVVEIWDLGPPKNINLAISESFWVLEEKKKIENSEKSNFEWPQKNNHSLFLKTFSRMCLKMCQKYITKQWKHVMSIVGKFQLDFSHSDKCDALKTWD